MDARVAGVYDMRGGIDARVAGVCMDMYILKDECIININYE